MIKSPSLSEINFSILLPTQKYPFAIYENGFKNPDFYLSKIRNLKNSLKPFRLHIIRTNNASTSLNVTLENYEILEDAEKIGKDIIVNLKLKEYRHFATIKTSLKSGISRKINLKSENNNSSFIYIVKKGDCLWSIAQKYLDNGNNFKQIYNDNKTLIDKGNLGTDYPIYTIYPGQKLIIKKGENI